MRSACFTGHRRLNEDSTILSQRLYDILEKHLTDGLTDYYIGGAIGFDTVTALTVLKLKEKYPFIKLHLVLPCPPDEQSKYWSDSDRRQLFEIIAVADSVEQTVPHYNLDCMRKRNARLVEFADICFSYYNEKKLRSGTGQTVRMAQRKGIEVINLYR